MCPPAGPAVPFELRGDHCNVRTLVGARTQAQNRLRWHLHELDPELDPTPRGLGRLRELDRLAAWLDARSPSMVVRIAAELVQAKSQTTGGQDPNHCNSGAITLTLMPTTHGAVGRGNVGERGRPRGRKRMHPGHTAA